MFTMLLSRVDMKTPVATMRKVGHLFAGEDTEGICCLWKKERGFAPVVLEPADFFCSVSQLG
jgi:hypothetical protein